MGIIVNNLPPWIPVRGVMVRIAVGNVLQIIILKAPYVLPIAMPPYQRIAPNIILPIASKATHSVYCALRAILLTPKINVPFALSTIARTILPIEQMLSNVIAHNVTARCMYPMEVVPHVNHALWVIKHNVMASLVIALNLAAIQVNISVIPAAIIPTIVGNAM